MEGFTEKDILAAVDSVSKMQQQISQLQQHKMELIELVHRAFHEGYRKGRAEDEQIDRAAMASVNAWNRSEARRLLAAMNGGEDAK